MSAPAGIELALEDMRVVMDAAGAERAVIFGISEGTAVALLFAATYPERTAGLISFGGSARVLEAPDYPWGRAPGTGAQALQALRYIFEGPRRQAAELIAWIGNLSPRERRRFVDGIRAATDFPTAEASVLLARTVDVRSVLPDIDTPTLLIHGQADTQIPIERGALPRGARSAAPGCWSSRANGTCRRDPHSPACSTRSTTSSRGSRSARLGATNIALSNDPLERAGHA